MLINKNVMYELNNIVQNIKKKKYIKAQLSAYNLK